MNEAKDMRDEINTKINQYQHEIQELQIMVKNKELKKMNGQKSLQNMNINFFKGHKNFLTLEQ